MNFNHLKTAVAAQFERMSKHPMFRVQVEKNDLWDAYLAAYPLGTNPINRKRPEADCSCCKQFVRAVGDVVAIIDGQVTSLWDVKVPQEPTYEIVTTAMSTLVKSRPIANPFLHDERKAGTDKNFEQLTDKSVQTWTHFFVNIPDKFFLPKHGIPTALGVKRADHDVLLRSLNEITTDSIETTLDLIAQNSLYRGAEHKKSVEEFQKLKVQFDALTDPIAKDLFVWTAAARPAVTRIGNTAIGTLLYDLSEGKELERAVGAFESKVAPSNYKRTTAPVSKAMIEKAKTTLTEMGLVSALERRYATIHDISINNILYADRAAKKMINGDVFDDLGSLVANKVQLQNLERVEEVTIEKFLKEILPRADSLEVLVDNSHTNNFVSLIAPADPTAGALFKWPNKFSWSYNGDMADSIRERVKKAGGNVSGDLCCRLAWFNHDDLDLHMIEPNGNEICFHSRTSTRSGGKLDVDMNAGGAITREPVENIFYENRERMLEGQYRLVVNQYRKRETADVGFEAQIDYLGKVYSFARQTAVQQGADVVVAKFTYSHRNGVVIDTTASLPVGQATRTVWNLPTQTFHKVNVVMLSPNFWDEKEVGNKHYFFMLDGCKNDGVARGFFNEFLKSELDPHRKVFEMVGNKMKTTESDEQLSGLGFSSTKRDTLHCRVKGSFNRVVKIVF